MSLGDVAVVGAGNPAPQDKQLFEGGTYPFIRTADVGRIKIGELLDSQDKLNALGIKKLKLHRAGTILLPKSGASTFLDHRVMMGIDGYVSSHLATLWAKEDLIDRRFLFWAAQTIVASDVSPDSSYPTLSLEQIKEIEIPLPPLEEQRRIVAMLDEVFAAVATATAKAEKNLANAREIFTSHRERLLRHPSGEWAERPLSELCTIKHGFAFKSEYFCDAGPQLLLTPGNFFETGGYRERGAKQKYYNGPLPRGFVLRGGDLLVAMTEQAAGLLGSPILVPNTPIYLHNQRLGLVEPKPGVEWANEFFFHVFNTAHLRDQVHRTGTGQKVRHTSPAKIGDVVVKFPISKSEQLAVAALLDDLWSECEMLYDIQNNKLTELSKLKHSLLQKAFVGDLVGVCEQRTDIDFATPKFTAQIIAFAHCRHEAQQNQNTFGHVKAQKSLHLVESIGRIDLGRQPIKDAAGPNDFAHMLRATDWAAQQGFFEFVPRVGGKGYDFKKLANYNTLWIEAREAVAPIVTALKEAIDPIVPMVSLDAEVFVTVHAAWNNLLRDGATISDDAIVKEARDNWHSAKLKIPEAKFRAAIKTILAKSLAPNGSAKYVGGQSSLF